ncbi:hypothetical protein [Rhizobium favelukesii]|uniref:Uncharacterized protein n=1 Tax=Rhizobium favelukesii TaxID=348824 RepID=W6R8I6_9HYPH|nr:hypothetical protein [Rhizobium favelukesii]MCS0459947.1 hypothetical protein [Rhizobium favelukesii]CDM57224.1 hypothetical protein LPU83_1552 [Rhizobium favelukesii]
MLYAYLESIRCHVETDEVGSDEPYVIVTATDLSTTVPAAGVPVPIPSSRAYRYGPFGDVDGAETHAHGFAPFWGLFGEERSLDQATTIFTATLIENDEGSAEGLRGIIAAGVNSALFASLAVQDRNVRRDLVLQAVDSAAHGIPDIAPMVDDVVVGAREIFFTPADIAFAETGQTARVNVRAQGDGGDYTMTFALRNRGQAAWRFCHKCRSLFFDGTPIKGVCPAGGGHEAAGWTYYLPHEHPGADGGQPDWRFCTKCNCMHWAGDPAQLGVCSAGGAHAAAGYNFFLPHDHAGFGQDEWRFCDRCRSMFWNREANKGACPTGGGHRAQGFNFKLDYTP